MAPLAMINRPSITGPAIFTLIGLLLKLVSDITYVLVLSIPSSIDFESREH